MFLPILIGIVSILSLAVINATYGAKVSQFIHSKKPDTIKILKNKEDIVINAVNQYCDKNIDSCFKPGEIILIDKNLLINYLPKNTFKQINFDSGEFNTIELNVDTKKISINHNIVDTKKQLEYKSHYLSKSEPIKCSDNTEVPCSNNLKKEKEISLELQSKFLEKEEEIEVDNLSNELIQKHPDKDKIKKIEEKIASIQGKKLDIMKKNLDKK